MPIVNTRNNNKENIGKNIAQHATSAQSSVEISHPWNVLNNEPWASLGYMTSAAVFLFPIEDIDGNKLQIIIDPTIPYNSNGTHFVDLNVNHVKIGVQSLDLSVLANHEILIQNIITVVNNASNFVALNLIASVGSNSNTIIFSHSNSSIGADSNNHEIIANWSGDPGMSLQEILAIHTNISVNNNYSTGLNEVSNVTFDFINKEKKSGSVTLDPRHKIKTKEINNIFPKKINISKKKRENYSSIFDDNNSILYKEKSVNMNTNLPVADEKNNLIISSNNTFNLNTFIEDRDVLPEYYDYYMSDSQEKSYDGDPFNENSTFYQNNSGDFSNENEIEIDIDFDIPCILSNNRIINPANNSNPAKYELLQSIMFPIKVEDSSVKETVNLKRYTAPTAYFNFSENRWDYLGNIKKPTYLEDSEDFSSYTNTNQFSLGVKHVDDGTTFDASCDNYESFTKISNYEDKIETVLLNNYICFNGVTNDYSQNSFKTEYYRDFLNQPDARPGPSFDDIINKHTGSIGMPISNYGFPYSGKYEPFDSHKIKLKDYIHKDFYLKKVVFDGVVTSFIPGRAELSADEVNATNLIGGTKYRIVKEGDTDWSSVGAGNLDSYVGISFTASGPAQSSTDIGTAKEANNSGSRIGINNVSLFLLNNRKNLNESYFNKIEEQQTSCISWDYDNLNASGNPFNLITKSFPRASSPQNHFKISDLAGDRRKFSYLDANNSYENITGGTNSEGDSIVINHHVYFPILQQGNETKSSNKQQRELITYNNVINFCSGSLDSNSNYFCVDYEKIKKESDLFLELDPLYTNGINQKLNERDNSSGYYKKNIQVESKVKSGTVQNQVSIYSHFPVLTSNKHGKRSLYNFNSGRSNKHEIYSASKDNTVTSNLRFNSRMLDTTPVGETDLNITSVNYEESYANDEYILKPSDEITIGASLTSSFNNPEGRNGNLGDDIFIIHSLKAKLIGSYKKRGIKKSVFAREENNNIINRSIMGDNDVIDESLTTPIQLVSNYFTREYSSHGLSSSYINKDQILEKNIKQFVSLKEEVKEYIYDSLMNNILDVIEVDNKKIIDEDWQEHISNGGSHEDTDTLIGYLITVPQNFQNPTVYDNETRVSSFPFEQKYNILRRPIAVDYEALGLKGIADTLSFQMLENKKVLFPVNPLFDNANKNIQTYFYSFYRENENKTRMPLAIKTSGSAPDYEWFNNEYDFKIDGFRYGVFNTNSVSNTFMFSNKSYGNFSDKINENKNYAKINIDGDVEYTVTKKFFIDYIPVSDISALNNTYNKDFHARSAKPFFDVAS